MFYPPKTKGRIIPFQKRASLIPYEGQEVVLIGRVVETPQYGRCANKTLVSNVIFEHNGLDCCDHMWVRLDARPPIGHLITFCGTAVRYEHDLDDGRLIPDMGVSEAYIVD